MSLQETLKTHLQENHFITPSYTLYDGLSGFQDYGPLGFMVRTKLLALWRKHFLVPDNISEVETPVLMSYPILKASGHIDRFSDFVVYDYQQKCHRADHLVKAHMNELQQDSINAERSINVDSMSPLDLETYINEHQLVLGKAVHEGITEQGQGDGGDRGDQKLEREPVKVTTKNLMLRVDELYLRPELAQGIFVNFKRYLEFNRNRLPFGISQLGKSFRREISPQQFVRLREFTQFEIEYFFDPLITTHDHFNDIRDIILPLFTGDRQLCGQGVLNITVAEAVNQGIICNQILAYFLARIYQFAEIIGLDRDKIRFRQHLPTEKSHYASDCWDFECMIDGDWLECAGCANRQSYDLKAHSSNNRHSLTVKRDKRITKVIPLMKCIGKVYKANGHKLSSYLMNLDSKQVFELQSAIISGQEMTYIVEDIEFTVIGDMVEFSEQFEEFYPHVIEPSFGIDRLMYAVFSHNFYVRPDDEQRIVLSLNQNIAPYDVAILQLSNDEHILGMLEQIHKTLRSAGLTCYIDQSGVAIGRRYARIDKIGIKTAITVDFDSLTDRKVTIRERDTMQQVRVEISKLSEKFPLFEKFPMFE